MEGDSAGRQMTRSERIQARHLLQELAEHARAARNAMDPLHGMLAITAGAWQAQWQALKNDLDLFTAKVTGAVVNTPCLICAVQAQQRGWAFAAVRGLNWPVTEIRGHTVHRACAGEAARVMQAAETDLRISADGVGRWVISGKVIPPDTAALAAAFEVAPGLDLAANRAAYDVETAAAFAAYAARQPQQPSGEELAGMRAAFGAGETVVDVITGRATHL